MSCTNTSDTCHKFADYFCSTYIETIIFPPSLFAKFRLPHIVLIMDRSLSIGISVRSLVRRIARFSFYCDVLVKQLTVTYIAMNDINTVAAVTNVERKRRQQLFRSWNYFINSRVRDSSSCALSVTVTQLSVCDL